MSVLSTEAIWNFGIEVKDMNCESCVCNTCPMAGDKVEGYALCWNCVDCRDGSNHCEYCSTKESYEENEQ